MRPFPAREVAAALARKGFSERENDHTFYHYRYHGRDVGVSTKISHGEREIGIGLVKRMRAQMVLRSNAEFQRYVECPMSQEDYEQILREQGIIRDDPT
jgi:predicted RNA binding protein YcfA (HicA-like mRNA interferase family)